MREKENCQVSNYGTSHDPNLKYARRSDCVVGPFKEYLSHKKYQGGRCHKDKIVNTAFIQDF